jgi:23S rRNA pseudouridine2605 synthase
MGAKLRLQRFLAQAGLASRRKAEELILSGKVKVNGRVISELGVTIDPERDVVTFAGERVFVEDLIWLLLNKPKGVMCTTQDPEGRQTVLDLVGNQGARLYPVGRLDYNTEGALLLTNDGELAHALMHPRHEIPRVYHVKLRGIVDPDDLDRLRQGVKLDTGEKVSAQVHIIGTTEMHTWIEMTLMQGLNHQIHRMIDCIGGTVLKLVRVAFSELTTEGLRVGHYRALTQAEINLLRQAARLPQYKQRGEAILPRTRRARGMARQTARRSESSSGKDAPRRGKIAPALKPRSRNRRTPSPLAPRAGSSRQESGFRPRDRKPGRKPATNRNQATDEKRPSRRPTPLDREQPDIKNQPDREKQPRGATRPPTQKRPDDQKQAGRERPPKGAARSPNKKRPDDQKQAGREGPPKGAARSPNKKRPDGQKQAGRERPPKGATHPPNRKQPDQEKQSGRKVPPPKRKRPGPKSSTKNSGAQEQTRRTRSKHPARSRR